LPDDLIINADFISEKLAEVIQTFAQLKMNFKVKQTVDDPEGKWAE
jgi:hypothetical protein